jgi:hypothetical protein
MAKCQLCGTTSPDISKALGVCLICIRRRLEKAIEIAAIIAESMNLLFLKNNVQYVIFIILNLLPYVNHILRFTTCGRYHNILWQLAGRKNHYP